MKTVIVNENNIGIQTKNGVFEKLLMPGKYRFIGNARKVELVSDEGMFCSAACSLDTLLKHADAARRLDTVEVPDQKIALHSCNGRFSGALTSGRYGFWNNHDVNTFREIDIAEPMAGADVPAYVFGNISRRLYSVSEVLPYQKGRLYYDGVFMKLLAPGRYYFWNNGTDVRIEPVDTRALQMNIQGQEMLTLDKVTLRVNFVCRYRITDFVKVQTEIDNYEEQIRVMAQLALREYIGRAKLDDILESRNEMAGFVLDRLKTREAECFVSFIDAGVKDIILPGEIRDIMNTVLIAEKKAQANVITRREEVASTRSLLNTAKLMEENATLMRLKEMEYIEKICDNVGNITVNGGGDLIGQLAGMLKGA